MASTVEKCQLSSVGYTFVGPAPLRAQGGLKEDPAGYYGMPRIRWEYWPACLSTHGTRCLHCTTLALTPQKHLASERESGTQFTRLLHWDKLISVGWLVHFTKSRRVDVCSAEVGDGQG